MAQDTELAQRLIRRFDRASGSDERRAIENYWQDVCDLARPLNSFTGEITPGQRRDRRMFDNTAAKFSRNFAGALHGLMTNPATPWFGIRDRRAQLNLDPQVLRWNDDTVERMRWLMSTPRFGFDTQSQEAYQDMVDFGTAATTLEDHPKGPRYVTHPLCQTYFEPDGDCNVRGVFRKWTVPLIDALDLFGKEAMHPKVLQRIEQNPEAVFNDKITLVHASYERSRHDPTRLDGPSKRYASVYLDKDNAHVLRKSGFDRWPWMTPRFSKVSGWVYGVGPSMMLVADIGMINAIRATNIEAAELAVHPPLVVQANSIEGPLSVAPRSVIYTRMGSSSPVTPLNTGARVDLGEQILELERKGLSQGYFLDLLLLPEIDRMTTVEVMQRVQQRMVFLSPIVSRLVQEWLSPLVESTFMWLRDNDQLAPLPEAYKRHGGRLQVDFVSVMAMSQRAGQANAYLQWMASIMPLVEHDPSVMDWIDSDAVAQHLAHGVYNLPKLFTRDPRVVAERRAARQELQMRQAQAEIAAVGAQAAERGAHAIKLVSEAQTA